MRAVETAIGVILWRSCPSKVRETAIITNPVAVRGLFPRRTRTDEGFEHELMYQAPNSASVSGAEPHPTITLSVSLPLPAVTADGALDFMPRRRRDHRASMRADPGQTTPDRTIVTDSVTWISRQVTVRYHLVELPGYFVISRHAEIMPHLLPEVDTRAVRWSS